MTELKYGILIYVVQSLFLCRRRVYTLINIGRLDDAEEALKKMLDENCNKEYAQSELEYIKEFKKGNGHKLKA